MIKKEFQEEEKDYIRKTVNKAMSFMFDGYFLSNMIDDIHPDDLTEEEKEWAKENLTYTIVREDKEGEKLK